MNILITICARGGSKGIPGKNIKNICGKPLIEYTISLAKQFKERRGAIIGLSTDDIRIKEVAKELGLETNYIRPDYLATDTAGKIDTIKDLLIYQEGVIKEKFDYVLDLDVTSPLRNLDDLEKSFDLINNTIALSLFSVNPAARNPYFNMVEEKEDGFYSLVKINSDGSIMTRQSAPKVFDLNASFYWYRRIFFDSNYKTAITNKSIIYTMPHLCFDLDHQVDFEFMEFLLKQNKLDFKL